MQDLLYTLTLGLVQGLTEWLPVSSSAHIVLVNNLFNKEQDIALITIVHIASLLALLIYFRKDIKQLCLGVIQNKKEEIQQVRYIIVGSIPIAIVGLLYRRQIEASFNKPSLIAMLLLITAIFLFATKFVKGKEDLSQKNTFIIGIAQAAAVFPGISRSGITIATAQLQGIEKTKAATFAFLLAIPAITGAFLLEANTLVFSEIYLLSALETFLCAYLSLYGLMYLIKSSKMHYFGYYCAFLSLIFLLFL